MFNLKEQEVPSGQNLSADDILANIKKRLGLVDEPAGFETKPQASHGDISQKSPAQQPSASRTSATQIIGSNHQNKESSQLKTQSQQQNERQNSYGQNARQHDAIDDDFSFDLDFADATHNAETNASKAYRAYQNAMKSPSYDDVSQNQDNHQEELTDAMEEWNSLEEELNDDSNFDWEEDYNEQENEGNASSNESNQQQNSQNVYFLNNKATSNQERNAVNQDENNSFHEENAFGNLAANIESAIIQTMETQVREWCENNLENVCRKIIREELYKEKVQQNQ